MAAQKDFDTATTQFENIQREYGDSSWRTAEASKKKIQAFKKWNDITKQVPKYQKPLAPQSSDDLRIAVQQIVQRVGVFVIAFLSMFVMRQMPPRNEDTI